MLPYDVGLQLGAVWDELKANIRLAGSLGSRPAMPLFVMVQAAEYTPVRLAFAWVKSDDVPLILGQTNFFLEFEICFYRPTLEFEIKPTSE